MYITCYILLTQEKKALMTTDVVHCFMQCVLSSSKTYAQTRAICFLFLKASGIDCFCAKQLVKCFSDSDNKNVTELCCGGLPYIG